MPVIFRKTKWVRYYCYNDNFTKEDFSIRSQDRLGITGDRPLQDK